MLSLISSTNSAERRTEVASALYTTEILRLATSIPCLGRLSDPQGTSERRSPVCGSRILVDVSMDSEARVAALGLTVSACALGQASAALMAQGAIGKSVAELDAMSASLAAWLAGEGEMPRDFAGLDVFAPALSHHARHGAIRLPFEAVAEAAGKAAENA